MSADTGALLLQAVPFARTLGITFDARPDTSGGPSDDGRATCRLPDREDLHNHVAGPHAGAIFTLAESAAAAAMLTAFADQLTRAVPLVTGSTVRYHKLARGEVTARARLLASREEVLARLDTGERPEFEVEVEVERADGAVVATVVIGWTLRPSDS